MKTCEKCDEDPEVPDKDCGKSHSNRLTSLEFLSRPKASWRLKTL